MGQVTKPETDRRQVVKIGRNKMTTTTISHTTKNVIARKLAAQAALVLQFYSHGDARGLDLAASLEKEAHAMWRDAGGEDVPTWDLTLLTQEG